MSQGTRPQADLRCRGVTRLERDIGDMVKIGKRRRSRRHGLVLALSAEATHAVAISCTSGVVGTIPAGIRQGDHASQSSDATGASMSFGLLIGMHLA
jgi:hypothetical protein